ncbi:MAG: cytochrome peroxidase [Verrucomicrobiaceae bacterium]|nr:cytochrome peroxidase [Verrucomicrobiaceae bacterium]
MKNNAPEIPPKHQSNSLHLSVLLLAIFIALYVIAARATDVESAPRASKPLLPVLPPRVAAAALEALGRTLFFDNNLSASHKMSCASCHDPLHAYGPANAKSVQLGGADLQQQGTRAAPSLRYLQNVPAFTEHYYDEDFDESVDNGPTGGRTWDGRAPTAHDQAGIPLLSPFEMANTDIADVVATLQHANYAQEFRRIFGSTIFNDPQSAFKAASLAFEVFQQNAAEFYPYSSKYDAVLRGQSKLSAAEQRGLELFNDEQKGNCAHCHPSRIGSNGAFPAFSDFGYIAIGVPRNRELPANTDVNFHDLGLCGPYRRDLSDHADYCGAFRTPTLRNVALKQAFFHNGFFHTLEDVMNFYNERDIHPEKFYPRAGDGSIEAFDDLPAQYHENINVEPPFDRGLGATPPLSQDEIKEIIAFMKTLTDGYHP